MATPTNPLFTCDKQLATIVASKLVALGVEPGLADYASSWIVSDDSPRAIVGDVQVAVLPVAPSPKASKGSGWDRTDLQSVCVSDDVGLIEDFVLQPYYQPILKAA